ncbi:M48 family metallopeptidase [Alphaproteobacteria bacterium]|nr:M48 family metallopeptidase [Alphaproteobacteria bacterium]
MKILLKTFFIFFLLPVHAFEIIRDPVFENYFDFAGNVNQKENNVFLIDSNEPNAFVFSNKIFFTTGLLKSIEDEDTLRAIYFHELGHIKKNHLGSRKIKLENDKNLRKLNNIFSVGLAILSKDPRLGVASSLSLDKNVVNSFSKHSIRHEIEADDFMTSKIQEFGLNTNGLIKFFKRLPDQKNHYFQSHPRPKERINILNKYSSDEKKNNSLTFEWIKAKYSKKSDIKEFNLFFSNLEKGVSNNDLLNGLIDKSIVQYELYKKGFLSDQSEQILINLMKINDNSYIKIEFYNTALDTNLDKYYSSIEKEKHNKSFQDEYFYFLIMGKFYNVLEKYDLSNFYFCQFFQLSNSIDKSNFYCNNYDINNIPKTDMSYALFK